MDYNFGIEANLNNLTPFRKAFKDEHGRAATVDETRDWLGAKPTENNPNWLPKQWEGIPESKSVPVSQGSTGTVGGYNNPTAQTRQFGSISSQTPGTGQSSPMGGLLGLIKGITNAPKNISNFTNTMQQAGGNQTGNQGNTGGQGNDLIDIFQPDKYPTSGSGLPMERREEILNALIPQLLKSLENYEGNIDKSTNAAQELFQSQTRGGMKDNLQGILEQLSGRNMLNSSVASDSISKGMADIVKSGAEKGYETSMNNAALKAQMPTMLANISQLGGGSFSSDPLAPYRLLAEYDWRMM